MDNNIEVDVDAILNYVNDFVNKKFKEHSITKCSKSIEYLNKTLKDKLSKTSFRRGSVCETIYKHIKVSATNSFTNNDEQKLHDVVITIGDMLPGNFLDDACSGRLKFICEDH